MAISHLVSIICLITVCSSTTLYVVYTDVLGNGTIFTTNFGSINPTTGVLTPLFEIASYYDYLFSMSGANTAFDQKNNVFYFFDDSDSAFVYGINATTNKIFQLFSPNADSLQGVAFDSGKEELVIGGNYGQGKATSVLVVAMPAYSEDQPSSSFNFSKQFGETSALFAGCAVDPTTSIFYQVYSNAAYTKIFIAAVDIATGKAQSSPLNCQGYHPFYLHYDTANMNLFALSFEPSNGSWVFLTIDEKSFACSVTPLGIVTHTLLGNVDYDPTTQTLYILWQDQYTALITYNLKTNKVSPPLKFPNQDYDYIAFAVSST